MSQRLALRVSSQLVSRGASASRAATAQRACSSLSAASLDSVRSPLASVPYVLSGRRRMISSTSSLWEDAKPAEADADAGAAAAAEDAPPKGPSPFEEEVAAASTPGDEVPEWQNPRHHNNPDKDRVFEEEFGPDEEMPEVPLPPFDDGSGKVMASPELHAIADEIIHMNMIEVNELCQRIAEHFGIEEQTGPPAMMGGAGGDGAAGEEEAAVEEKTAFDLKLVSFDAKAKIKVIKEVRSIAGLGLKEAKELVEGAPKTVMKEIKKEDAEEMAKKLEELGAVVEIV